MKIQLSHRDCLLQATCGMLLFLVAVTYATSQAEVNAAQHLPPKPLKFGQKIVENEVFQPTSENLRERTALSSTQNNNFTLNQRRQQPTTHRTGEGIASRRPNESRTSNRQTSSRNENFLPTAITQARDQPRQSSSRRYQTQLEEYLSLPTHLPPAETTSHISRRHNAGGSKQNEIIVQQYDIPAVQKSHHAGVTPTTTVHKSANPSTTRGQQRSAAPPPATNANRSRLSHTNIIESTIASTLRSLTNVGRRQQSKTSTATTTIQPKSSRLAGTQKSSQHSTVPSSSASSSPTSRNSNHSTFVTTNTARNSNGSPNQRVSNRQHGTPPTSERSNGRKIVTTTASGQIQQQQKINAANHSSRSNANRKAPLNSSSTTAVGTTTPRGGLFSLPNEYNIFSPEFWSFLNPTTRATHRPTVSARTAPSSTKKPPKKYIPPQQNSAKEEKLKIKPTYPTTTTTIQTTTKSIPETTINVIPTSTRKDEGPFRIALPTFNILGARKESNSETDKDKRNVEDSSSADLRAKFNCPRESEVRFQLFPKICKIDDDCAVWNRGEICCEIFGAKSCVSGIPKPLEETPHSPILGLIPRKCPDRPLAELWWEVKECETDMDCWPRVCCPDGRRRYCRTSQPELNTVPVPVQRSFNYLTEYLECTAPPPPIFDLHPKACTSTLDCFPNVCCQEAGLRHCRPPKKSVLTMLANVFNVDLVKRLTQNIVIK